MSCVNVYPAPRRAKRGYVFDVQVDLVQDPGIVVLLLSPASDLAPARDLRPAFRIEVRSLLTPTQFVAAMPYEELKQAVTSLDARSNGIATHTVDIFLNKPSISTSEAALQAAWNATDLPPTVLRETCPTAAT